MFTMIIIAEVIIIKKETNADVSLMFSINDTMLWLLEKLYIFWKALNIAKYN